MEPVPVVRGPGAKRPRATVQDGRGARGRGSGRTTVSRTGDPTISRPHPSKHVCNTQGPSLARAKESLDPGIGFAAPGKWALWERRPSSRRAQRGGERPRYSAVAVTFNASRIAAGSPPAAAKSAKPSPPGERDLAVI